jgi:hypothetical protein
VSSVLTFVKNPDGTIVAQTAIATQDGQTVTPSGKVVPASSVVTIPTLALSFLRPAMGVGAQLLFGPGDAGQTVNGFQKLAQRFILHLFTIKGTMIYRPIQGCIFLKQVYQGKVSEMDIFAAFSASLLDIRRNIQAEESSTDPSNERYRSAQLKQLTVAQDIITLTIVIQNMAGDVLKVTVPLSFNL